MPIEIEPEYVDAWVILAKNFANMAESDPELLRTEFGKEIHGLVKGGDPMGAYALWGRYMAERDDPLKDNDALTRSVWERLTSYAEEYNQPGVFTALIQVDFDVA